MKDFIIALILIIIVGLACLYIYKEKKRGKKCIGCSESGCSECNMCNKKSGSK